MKNTTILVKRRYMPVITSRTLPINFSLLCAMVAFGATAHAEIVPTDSGPDVSQEAHQAARIDIQAPNEEGVSHNVYEQFDVDKEGAVLNNSRNGADTELAGRISGNPNLSEREARTIINEVNSRDPSRLNGMLEVAGQRADVIVANPSGITCNGCGFINSDRGVLTTGTPVMEDGTLKAFDVDRGLIKIEGQGLDGRAQKYTDILARAVVVNGKIQADNLRIITGPNTIDMKEPSDFRSKPGQGEAPTMALDVRSLGGMYANKIYMRGNEKGVGVRNSGELEGKDIKISSVGRIENSGDIKSKGKLDIFSSNSVSNVNGYTAAASLVIDIDKKPFDNRNGIIDVTDTANIDAGEVKNNSGTISAGHRLNLNTYDIHNSGGIINSMYLTVNTHWHTLYNNSSESKKDLFFVQGISGSTVKLKSGAIDNSGGHISGDEVYITSLGKTPSLNNGENFFLNKHGEIRGNLSVDIQGKYDTLDNTYGVIESKYSTILNTNNIINLGGSLQSGFGDMKHPAGITISVEKDLNNEMGEISGKSIGLLANKINNNNGHIKSKALDIDVKVLDNIRGKISSTSRAKINSQQFNNTEGFVNSYELDIDTRGFPLINRDTFTRTKLNHKLYGINGANVTIKAGSIDNEYGRINGNNSLNINTTYYANGKDYGDNILDNSNGLMSAGHIDINSINDTLYNEKGKLFAKNYINMAVNTLNNNGGKLKADTGRIKLDIGDSLENNGGEILDSQ